MFNEAIINTEDWKQIKALSLLYNEALHLKHCFIEKAVELRMTPAQRAEAELTLVRMTGELKQIDGLIHYLMFGGEMQANELCQSLLWYADKEYGGQMKSTMEILKMTNQDLAERNSNLRAALYALRRGRKPKAEVIIYPNDLNS